MGIFGRSHKATYAKALKLKKNRGPEAVVEYLKHPLAIAPSEVPADGLTDYLGCVREYEDCLDELKRLEEGCQFLIGLLACTPPPPPTLRQPLTDLLGRALRRLPKNCHCPEVVKGLGDLARRLFREGDSQSAVNLARIGLEAFPQSAELWELTAEGALAQGAWGDATAALRQAIAGARTPGAGLLELAERLARQTAASGTAVQAARAQAVLGLVFRCYEKPGFQKALSHLEKARKHFGAALDEAVDLLHVYRGLDLVQKFSDYAWEILSQRRSPAIATAIGAEADEFLRDHPKAAELALVMGVCQLELRCYEEAVRQLEHAADMAPALANRVLESYQQAHRDETGNAILNLALSRRLRRMGGPNAAWEILQRTAELPLTNPQKAGLCVELRDVAQGSQDPSHHRLLARCLLDAQDLVEAVSAAGNWLDMVQAVSAEDVALCDSLAVKCRDAALDDRTQASALRLAAESAGRAQQFDATVEYLQKLAGLQAIGDEELKTARDLIESLPEEVRSKPTACWVLAQLCRGQGDDDKAAEQLAAVVAASQPGPRLEQAAEQLEALLVRLADRARPCAALAQAHLLLDHVDKARPHVLECARQHPHVIPNVLASLDSAIAAGVSPTDVRTLLIDALVATEDPPRLSQALKEVERLFRDEPRPKPSPQSGQPIAGEPPVSPRGRREYQLDWRSVSSACRRLVDAEPTAAVGCVEFLTQALAWADADGQACLLLARAQVGAVGTESEGALDDLRRASESNSDELLDELVKTCQQLAQPPRSLTAAFLVAIPVEVRRGRGLQLLPSLLQLWGGFCDQQIPAVQQAIRLIRDKWPDSALAMVAEARIAHRQANLPGALDLYRQALERTIPKEDPEEQVLSTIVADLEPLWRNPKVSLEATFLLADARQTLKTPDLARRVLVERAETVPGDAAACAQRLGTWAQASAAGWRERIAWSYALWLAHAGDSALREFRAGLDGGDLNWKAEGREVHELAAGMSQHSGPDVVRRAILVAIEVRSLPPEELARPLKRIRNLISEPHEVSEAVLAALLEDCQLVEQRATDRERLLRRAAHNRARLLRRRNDGGTKDAANELAAFAERWPEFAGVVLAEAEAEIAREAVFRLPAAAACVAREDFPSGLRHLRELLQALPEYARSVADRAGKLAAVSVGGNLTEALLLQADACAYQNDFSGYRKSQADLLRESPCLWKEVVVSAVRWLRKHPQEPLLYDALVRAHASRRNWGLPYALAVVRKLQRIGNSTALEHAAALLEELRRDFPQDLKVHQELMTVRLRQGKHRDEAYEAFADDARQLRDQDPSAGPNLVLRILSQHLDASAPPPVLLYLRCQIEADQKRFEDCVKSLRKIREVASQAGLAELRRKAKSLDIGTLPACLRLFLAELAFEADDWEDEAEQLALVLQLTDLSDRDRTAVAQGLEAILGRQPTTAAQWTAQGRCAALAKQADRAALCYRQAAEASSTANVRKLLVELCEAFPQAPLPFLVLGEVHQRVREWNEAIASLEKARRSAGLSDTDRLLANRLLAKCHAESDDYPQALDALTRASELAPDDVETAGELLRISLRGLAHRVKTLQAACEADPQPSRQWDLGCALRDNGEYAAAIGRFQRSLCDPSLGWRSQLEIAKCQLQLQQCNLAVVNLRQTLAKAAESDARKEILYYLGVAYSRLLLFHKAIEAFEELGALDAGYRDAPARLDAVYRNQVTPNEFLVAEIPFDLLEVWRRLAKSRESVGTHQGD